MAYDVFFESQMCRREKNEPQIDGKWDPGNVYDFSIRMDNIG